MTRVKGPSNRSALLLIEIKSNEISVYGLFACSARTNCHLIRVDTNFAALVSHELINTRDFVRIPSLSR